MRKNPESKRLNRISYCKILKSKKHYVKVLQKTLHLNANERLSITFMLACVASVSNRVTARKLVFFIPSFLFFLLSSQLSRRTREETLATQATFMSNGKRELIPRDQACRLLFIISTHSSSFMRFFIQKNFLSCFYLLIFYFEKFLT